MHPALEDLRKLPVTEKVQVVEELWDEIANSGEEFPLPAWHHAEAQRRAAELAQDPSIELTEEELWRLVDQRNA